MFNCGRNELAAPDSLIRAGLAAIAMLAGLSGGGRAAAQSTATAAISSPATNQVLRGAVSIMGTADSADFASAELDFAYATDSSNTWFLIQTLDQSVVNGAIATWDTNAISDGDYDLRLRVNSLDGTFQDASVSIEVRNYTAPRADKPTPAPTQAPILQIPSPQVIVPSQTPLAPPPSTPTLFPPNPAASTVTDTYGKFWQGALFVVGLFVLVGVLLRRRR
jgi:hypothetical protein